MRSHRAVYLGLDHGQLPSLAAAILAVALLAALLPASQSYAAAPPLRIGFIDPSLPGKPGAHNAAALAYARTQGDVTRLKPLPSGGWQAADGRLCAPEEFDVVWYNQGDATQTFLSPANVADLKAYLEGGGGLLLSGMAGEVLHDMGVEPTAPRILGPTTEAYASGIVVKPAHRHDPLFAGLDTSKPIVLTSIGGTALADFYATAGPTGELLANGNAGLGERPLVEYHAGAGTAIFVGWRLADFTTARDAYRPDLDRLFANMLRYLAAHATNRARLVAPLGGGSYVRVLGVPFLRAASPVELSAPAGDARCAVTLGTGPAPAGALKAGDLWVKETAPAAAAVRARALALTLTSRERPASSHLAELGARQAAMAAHDRALMAGLAVVKPHVTLEKAPLRPSHPVEPEQAVILGRSPFMAPGDGLGAISPVYSPVEDGGFRIEGGTRRLNRSIVEGQNRVWTGDVPLFMMDTTTGNGCYSSDRTFPLWPRPDAEAGNVYPRMGTLRIGVVAGPGGAVQWMDDAKSLTTFRPGYTEYVVTGPAAAAGKSAAGKPAWRARILVAPAHNSHGMICRVEFSEPRPLVWRFGGIWWSEGEDNANKAQISGRRVRITEPNLPKGEVWAGWDGDGAGRVVKESYGEGAEFTASRPRKVYHIVATWGVTSYDKAKAAQIMARLDNLNTAAWPALRDRLKRLWFDNYIAPALNPEKRFDALMAAPGAALHKTVNWWDARRRAFQVHTPSPYFDAVMNFARCIEDYHLQGPGYVLGDDFWFMYSHISTGWYGAEWGGDHQQVGNCLRLYGAMQADDGFVRWISPSLAAFNAEDNTPYWVDQVWRHYTWTGDKQFLRDMWPMVRKAITWMRRNNDPDGDGLFRDYYEYWNCDSNGKGPKSTVPSALAWAMMDRASRIAGVLGDAAAEAHYRALADKTRDAIFRELWRDDKGRLGCIGADGLWCGHPQIWEEYLPILAGLLGPARGRRAMRWVAEHYGFTPSRDYGDKVPADEAVAAGLAPPGGTGGRPVPAPHFPPDVHLLACSDWYPIRWSCQWVPTGDTCLAALAGMRCGDGDLWWPYLKTVVMSSFRSDFPGINMGISDTGAGGGDHEDVDSQDPHVYVTVRGLFGIDPALQDGRIDICPAFPSGWTHASITTPDLSYDWHREGDVAVFRITTPGPTVKRVRANLSGPVVVTPRQRRSVVRVRYGPPPPKPKPATKPTLPRDRLEAQGKLRHAPLPAGEARRQVLFDLSGAYNVTPEQMVTAKFTYDYSDSPATIAGWWGNPGLALDAGPRAVKASNGVVFLTSGRPPAGLGPEPKSLLAVSSWRPYPLPGGVEVSVGRKCETLWLLLQSYVHPMKNYVENGEVVLRYADGARKVVPLVPPYNLDAYFQHFSLQGVPVPLGRLTGGRGGFIAGWHFGAHADALAVPCDPGRVLASVEIRGTCTEGVIGVAGMTAVAAPGGG